MEKYLSRFLIQVLSLGQVVLKGGRYRIADIDMTTIPTVVFVQLVKYLEQDLGPRAYVLIYREAKGCGKELMRTAARFGFDEKRTLTNICTRVGEFTGWGEFETLLLDFEKRHAIFHVTNSAFPELWGPSKEPVCHFHRGLMAGQFSVACGADVECVETSCVAMGSSCCEFFLKPLEEFDSKDPQVRKQLGLD